MPHDTDSASDPDSDPDTGPATEPSRRTWQLARSSPMRADAESIFVPAADLPGAALGDTVVVSGEAPDDERTGTVADTSARDGEPYLRIQLRAS